MFRFPLTNASFVLVVPPKESFQRVLIIVSHELSLSAILLNLLLG